MCREIKVLYTIPPPKFLKCNEVLYNAEVILHNWKSLDKILWKFARLIVELPYCWLLFELDRTSEIFCWQKKHILSKLLIDKKHILLKLPTVQIQVDYEQERQGTWVWSDIILQKCESIEIREAILYQIGCFFTHCVKGGRGGVVPMCKNLCCGFL